MNSFAKFTLCAAVAALPALAQVQIAPGVEKISVQIDGKPFTTFYVAGPEVMKPYLFPLRAASGTYITRMFPMETVEEEAKASAKDHPHQRGLWFAHAGVNGLDFWNNEASYTTPNRGKMVLGKPVQVKSGKASGTITADFDWTDLKGGKILTEHRVMTFHKDPSLRIVDFDITLTAVQKAVFKDEKDGAFGLRLRPVLQEDTGTGHIVNAQGLETEKALWGKPSEWCDYSGTIGGERVGVAILDHPKNLHSPARWHARGYGLFAVNPFGLSAFTNDKSQDGTVTLEPGKSLRYRYRLIIHPGDAKSANIAEQWKKYAASAK